MAAPVLSNPSSLDDLARLFATLSPQFGSGKGTTSTTGALEPGAAAQEEQLFGNILASTNPEDIDNMVSSILQRAKQAFGPAAIASNAAGVRGYSDTVQESSRNEAMARATGEAAAAKLDAINKANATAANLTANRMQATKSTQVQTKTNATPMGKTLALALAASALKKPFGKAIDAVTGGAETAGPEQLSGPTGPDEIQALNANNPNQFDNAITEGFSSDTTILPIDAVNAVDVIPDVTNVSDTSPDAVGTPDVTSLPDIPDTEVTDVVDSGGDLGDIMDFFGGFADGGYVGRRNYADGGAVRKYPTLYIEPTTGKVLPTNVIPLSKNAKGGVNAGATGVEGGDSGVGNAAGLGSTSAAAGEAAVGSGLSGLAEASIGLSAALGFGQAGLAGAIASGITTAAHAMAAQGIADAFGVTDLSGNTTLGAGFEGAPEGSVETGTTAGDTSADAAAGASGDASAGASGDSGGDDAGGDSGGDSGGGDGGGDGGGGEAEGGLIQGKAGVDVIPIHVTEGEYVLPKDIVDMIGVENLDKLIRQHHTPVHAGGR